MSMPLQAESSFKLWQMSGLIPEGSNFVQVLCQTFSMPNFYYSRTFMSYLWSQNEMSTLLGSFHFKNIDCRWAIIAILREMVWQFGNSWFIWKMVHQKNGQVRKLKFHSWSRLKPKHSTFLRVLQTIDSQIVVSKAFQWHGDLAWTLNVLPAIVDL